MLLEVLDMEIEVLLQRAVEERASDLHLTVGMPPTFRRNGNLVEVAEEVVTPEETQKLAYYFMSAQQVEIFEARGQLEFSYSASELGRFRISIFRQRSSIGIALRPVPIEVPTIEDLGLPEILKDLACLKSGLILITGPNGSGKSTTLAAMLNYINQTKHVNILTIENPIEYLHKHRQAMVNQRELGIDTHSYSDALKIALKQDPDVILIDELEDLSTLSAAINAAEKGHLVLTTLHTLGAVATVDRIVDAFPKDQQQQAKTQLSNVLQGVVSQQLISSINKTDRMAAMEIMICNPAIRNHIREGKAYQIMNSIQTSKKEGMFSMDAHLVELYKSGLISQESCISHSVDKDWVMKML